MDLSIEAGSVLARLAVGLVLLLAGIGKLRADGSVFLKAILAFETIPQWAARPVAKGLPWLEVGLGASMLIGFCTQAASLLSFALIATLSAVVVHALAKGKRVFCACLGFSAAQVAHVQWTTTLRNLVLLLACAFAASAGDAWRVDRLLGRADAAPSTLVLAAMVAAFCVLACGASAVRLGWAYAAQPAATTVTAPQNLSLAKE